MIQQIEQRLKELKGEFEAGQKMLAELETRQANARNTLLRISGAIQALEELLSPAKIHSENGARVPAIADASPVA
jgi:chromosome segregation ATPase